MAAGLNAWSVLSYEPIISDSREVPALLHSALATAGRHLTSLRALRDSLARVVLVEQVRARLCRSGKVDAADRLVTAANFAGHLGCHGGTHSSVGALCAWRVLLAGEPALGPLGGVGRCSWSLFPSGCAICRWKLLLRLVFRRRFGACRPSRPLSDVSAQDSRRLGRFVR